MHVSMGLRVAVALSGLALAATSSLPSHDAHARETERRRTQGYIHLSGAGGGYVDVTLKKEIVFDIPQEFDPQAKWFKSTGPGRVVGWQIEQLPERRPVMSAVWLRYLDEDPDVSRAVRLVVRPVGTDDQTLRPGRYRFVLIAPEGKAKGRSPESSVSIPTTGRSMRLRTSKSSESQVITDEIDVLPGAPTVARTEDLELAKGTTVILGATMTLASPPTQQLNAHTCLMGPKKDSYQGLCTDLMGISSGAVADRYWGAIYRFYQASELNPGAYKALWRMNGIGMDPERVRILMFAFGPAGRAT